MPDKEIIDYREKLESAESEQDKELYTLALLAEAHKRITDGEGTPEDHTLVDVFEAGAEAHQEMSEDKLQDASAEGDIGKDEVVESTIDDSLLNEVSQQDGSNFIDDPIERAVDQTAKIKEQIAEIEVQLNDPLIDDNLKQELDARRDELNQHLDFFERRLPGDVQDQSDKNTDSLKDPDTKSNQADITPYSTTITTDTDSGLAGGKQKIEVVDGEFMDDSISTDDTPESADIVDGVIVEDEPAAIEAAPERKAIEAAPEEPLPELSFTGGMVKDTLKHVGEEAVDRIEDEKTEIAENLSGLGGFRRVMRSMRNIPRNMKFTGLFKRETERKRGEEVMEDLMEDEQSTGEVFSIGRLMALIHGQSIESVASQERAFITALENDEMLRAGDAVERGEDGQDSPVVAQFRASLKDHLFTYVDSTADDMMDDERRAELTAEYEWNVQELIRETMEANPGFSAEDFNVQASNMFELAENARAYLRHEDGRQQLETQLDMMKITIGQAKIGPNSSYNTEYLERTVDLMRQRRVGSVVGKASFVAATWVVGGAVTAGLAQWAAQSASSSGTRYGAAAVGGALLGPAGAAVGFGAGVAASAVWGRYLGRKRAAETVSMMEVKSGDSGNSEITELFKQLQQDSVSFTLTTDNLRSFLEPANSSGDTVGLRQNISSADLNDLINGIAEVRVRLGVERATNTSAQNGNVEREINLFMSSDGGSAQAQRVEMIQTLQQVEALLQEQYAESGLPIAGDDSDPVTYDDAIAKASAESATALRARMLDVEQRRIDFVDTQGRNGAKAAAIITGIIGIGGAGAAELISHGNATTIFDTIGVRGNTAAATLNTNGGNILQNPNGAPASVKGGNVTVDYNQVGASNVSFTNGGKEISITTPTGQQTIVHPSARGTISPAEITMLKQQGVDVIQNPTSKTVNRTFGIEKFLRREGGKPTQVDEWFTNGTERPDGTELGANISSTKSGDIVVGQDAGVAVGPGGQTIDIAAAAKGKDLFAYFTHKGTAVKVPLKVASNGEIQYTIKASSPLHALFEKTPEGRILYKGDMWHVGVSKGKGSFDSISTVFGLKKGDVDVDVTKYACDTKVVFNTPGEADKFYIPGVGVATSLDHDRLYNRNGEPNEDNQPIIPQPPQDSGDSGPNAPPSQEDDDTDEIVPPIVPPIPPSQGPDTGPGTPGEIEEARQNGGRPITPIAPPVTITPPVQAGPRRIPVDDGSVGSPELETAPRRPELEATPSQPELEAAPSSATEVVNEPPTERQETKANTVQVQPMSPRQITQRLQQGNLPQGLEIEISGQRRRVERVDTSNGAPRLLMVTPEGSVDTINIDSLEDAIADGKVRFNHYLGTPDAAGIVADLRRGEVLYDKELGATIRITRKDPNNTIVYEVFDSAGNPLLREPNSNPRVYTAGTLESRIASGSLVPIDNRGVTLA